MKSKMSPPWVVVALVLASMTLPLRANPTNIPAARFNRAELREQLKNLSPEERRAKIEALRNERAAQAAGRDEQPGRRALRDAPRGERPPIAGPPGRFQPSFDRVLTEEQRASLREAMAGERDTVRDLEDKIREARKAMLAAGLAEKFDETAVRSKALEIGRLEADLVVLRAKTFSKIKPPPSAEQIERIKNLPGVASGDGMRRMPLRHFPGRGPRPAGDWRGGRHWLGPPKPMR